MPLAVHNLGDVLTDIYRYPFGGAIYLPEADHYEICTPCFICWSMQPEDAPIEHSIALSYGFSRWLNIAVVSDTCDEVTEPTPERLVAAFNADCREGGWLAEMMNYWSLDNTE